MPDLVTSVLLTWISTASLAAYSDNGYITVGLGVHPKIDGPVVSIDNPVFDYEAGITKKKFSVFYRHNSSLLTIDEGAGLNMLGIKYRIK